MQSVMYTIWLVFIGIYFLQGAVTGSLRKRRGMSADAVWPIPQWARLLCLFVSGLFGAAAIFVFIRAFPN
jgi:hypothetical protein